MSILPALPLAAAIYARKSTEQNVADEQRSVARQIQGAREYANLKGWAVAEDHVYFDDGISGAEFKTRPGFLRLMNAVSRQPAFQVLIMSEESRLGREAIETGYALKQLLTAGVRVFFYLEDRERKLESPTDKLLLSVTGYVDELERERARQRTTDAMRRKADAGHVTGGRVYGYENHTVFVPGSSGQPVRSHVERRIKPNEAAVVRRIFELCRAGGGFRRIAKQLNSEGAPAPRPQQQRPRGWTPSSVGEVLYRALYRGEIIWNKTQKRDGWGQRKYLRRDEGEWVKVAAPHLRIVSDELWAAAHERLGASRQNYLRHTNGRVWGRPANGVESKYLLTGMALCGVCGGGMLTRSRKANRQRSYLYGCAANYLRGADICANSLEIPMAMADGAVLQMVEENVLTPAVIEEAIEQLFNIVQQPSQDADERVDNLHAEIDRLEAEIVRLTEGIATLGASSAIVGALKQREGRLQELRASLGVMQGLPSPKGLNVDAIRWEALQQLSEWRGLLAQNVPIARQILRKVLEGRLVFVPRHEGDEHWYEFSGEGSLTKFFSGVEPLSNAMASPPGFEPGFQP